MKPEQHLFIIWEKARYKEKEILEDIQKKMEVTNIFEVSWTLDHFHLNLSRFYGLRLPNKSEKERHCGNGKFLLVLVVDKNPLYQERPTSRGLETVNINMFDCKMLYRTWTGGGHRIHATNSLEETRHDLSLLLGYSIEEYERSTYFGERNRITLKQDLVGTNGWKDLRQLFGVLNATVKYVVMRNYERLPDHFVEGQHGDIDILTENYKQICLIANTVNVYPQKYRVRNKAVISGKDVYFDFRYVGDGYYDNRWEREVLSSRLFHNGIYVPDKLNEFFSLMYHAYVHKLQVAPDYYEKLGSYASQLRLPLSVDILKDYTEVKLFLDSFMIEKGYQFTEPKDLSVYCNPQFVNPRQISLRRKWFSILIKYKEKLKKRIRI